MKKTFYLFLLSFGLTVTVIAQSKQEQAVITAVESLNAAMVNADKDALEKLTANDLRYGHSNGKIDERPQYIQDLVGGKVDFSVINTTGQTVQLKGKTAIVRHLFAGKFSENGISVDLKIGVLMVWIEQGGQWKLQARQGYKIP